MTALTLLSAFIFSFGARAAGPVITSISNASGSEISTGGNIIYGGLAGEDCSSGASGTCNSCDTALMGTCLTAPLCACNTARIYDGLTLRINVTPPAGATDGELKMLKIDGGVNTIVTKLSTNDRTFIDFDWATICNAAASSSCAALAASVTSATSTFTGRLFVDKPPGNDQIDSGEETTDVSFKIMVPTTADYSIFNNPTSEGIGGATGFYPYPGDEKIYVKELETSSGYPSFTYGGKAKTLRVFYSENGLASAIVGGSSKDLELDSDGAIIKNTVSGLTNNTTYVFRVALVDQASNVVQFWPDVGAGTDCDSPPDFTSCAWAATPEKVLGLLTEDVNCFIATAAYGSALEPKIDTFREFRNRFLLSSQWGRRFIDSYYKYGPKAARMIYDKPILRALTRGLLWPFYIFSWTALHFGFVHALLLVAMAGAAFFAFFISLRRCLARTL